jgi:hypothetical protein
VYTTGHPRIHSTQYARSENRKDITTSRMSAGSRKSMARSPAAPESNLPVMSPPTYLIILHAIKPLPSSCFPYDRRLSAKLGCRAHLSPEQPLLQWQTTSQAPSKH